MEERENVGEEHETRKPQSKGLEAALCLDRPGSGKAARNRKDDVGLKQQIREPSDGEHLVTEAKDGMTKV